MRHTKHVCLIIEKLSLELECFVLQISLGSTIAVRVEEGRKGPECFRGKSCKARTDPTQEGRGRKAYFVALGLSHDYIGRKDKRNADIYIYIALRGIDCLKM